jgi:hypothetical protein
MNETTNRPRFHLAIGVDDLSSAAHFYGVVLGCSPGRTSDIWMDWNLYGHQVVTHLVDTKITQAKNSVDDHDVPVPHFGLILTVEDFHQLAERMRSFDTKFVIEPYVRFVGKVGEQWTMFFLDPAGNAIECKAFAEDAQVFAH